MKIKPNYFIIPLVVILISVIGSYFTSQGVGSWYQTINLSEFTPAGSVIGAVWTVIFILTAVSALLFWNKKFFKGPKFWLTTFLFLANGLLNVFWSYLFFYKHYIGVAVLEAGLLGLSVLLIMVLLWGVSKKASLLLLPYFIWVCFATYLNYIIWMLN